MNDDARPKAPPAATPAPTTAAQHNVQAGATVNRYHFIPKKPKRQK